MIFREGLAEHYGITPDTIREVEGGWSARAFRVDAADRAYFLKVYDRSLPSTEPWIERIDSYMPVLSWLSARPELRPHVPRPILSAEGLPKVEAGRWVWVLFDFIPGAVPGNRGLSCAQMIELAGILATLHPLAAELPHSDEMLCEDNALTFCNDLEDYFLAHGGDALWRHLAPAEKLLRAAISKTRHLRDTARLNADSTALCHTDAHGDNLIQSDRLVLVDWEDVKFAPPEVDLFMYAEHPCWRDFLGAYCANRPGFVPDAALLMFYRLRRRVEDIAQFIARVLCDGPTEAERAEIFMHLGEAVKQTEKLLSGDLPPG